MIGSLPTSLEISGKEYEIRSDYRVALTIFEALEDTELADYEKAEVVIQCLYVDDIPEEVKQEALEKAVWFLDCGDEPEQNHIKKKPLYSWEQDEQIIFSAVNKVAGKEIRSEKYIHFWTFIGYFNEIGEGTFSTIISIRDKKNKGKKLEKWEKDFYMQNKNKIDLKKKYTAKDISDLQALEELLKQ